MEAMALKKEIEQGVASTVEVVFQTDEWKALIPDNDKRTDAEVFLCGALLALASNLATGLADRTISEGELGAKVTA